MHLLPQSPVRTRLGHLLFVPRNGTQLVFPSSVVHGVQQVPLGTLEAFRLELQVLPLAQAFVGEGHVQSPANPRWRAHLSQLLVCEVSSERLRLGIVSEVSLEQPRRG